MEKKITNFVNGFFIVISLTMFTVVILELAGYEISGYELGYLIGRFLRSLVSLF